MKAVAALLLPLWLAPCSAGSGPAGGTAMNQEPAGQDAPLVPAPQPQAAPPTASPRNGGPANTSSPETPLSSGPLPDTPASDSPGNPGVTEPGRGTASGSAGGAGVSGQGGAAGPGSAPAPGAPAGPLQATPTPAPADNAPGNTASGNTAGVQTVTAYYVLLDDGGSGGVRFGCNDSLVGVRRSIDGSTEPLPAAIRALLDGSAPSSGLYNSLSASTLEFLAGSFDGTTVTVYLSGSIRPAGTCDVPRVEAQLTQTAVSSVGAIRAEIYVNGVGLTEALSPR